MAKAISISDGRREIDRPGAKHVAKKAAKKSAKKAAKKVATKHTHEGPSNKHELRAYGHLGRLAVLRLVEGDKKLAPIVRRLIELAEASDQDEPKSMAELLRAAEHVAFAGAQSDVENPLPLHPALEQQIMHEFEKLQERAESDAPEDEDAAQLQSELLLLADDAYQAALYTPALELIRAAEALAHA